MWSLCPCETRIRSIGLSASGFGEGRRTLGVSEPRVGQQALAGRQADDERRVAEPGDRNRRCHKANYTGRVHAGPSPRSSSSAAGASRKSPAARAPKPEWLKVRAPGSQGYLRLKGLMRDLKLNTVCEEAHCPNIGECWHHGTATFMIMGDVCTRACGYCNVTHGAPSEARSARAGEPGARPSQDMELAYVVVTSVDRDDLPDFGAGAFAATIRAIKARRPGMPRRSADPGLPGKRSVAAHGAGRAAGHPESQHRDGAAALPHRAARRPLHARARTARTRAHVGAGHSRPRPA